MPDNDQQTIPDRLRELEPTTREDVANVVEPRDWDDETSDAEPEPEDASAPFAPIPRPALRKDVSVSFAFSLLAAAAVLALASWLGLVPWLASLSIILLLATTLVEGWGRVTALGALVVGIIMIFSFWPSPGDSTPVAQASEVTTPVNSPPEPVTGSLGVSMDQLTESWNTVTGPPQITRGLTRHNETGAYDTFIYRFGEWGRFAGAFDPADEAVYALLATGQFSQPATDQLYLHLCFVVAPYSQECIDAYNEQGLDGGTLEDFVDTTQTADWSLGDHTWNLEMEGNVLTIRVYGADAAP